MDFLIAYCEPWHTALRTSKHHYAERLAKLGHRILYVEVPFTPLSAIKYRTEFKQSLSLIKSNPVQVTTNIWSTTGFYPLPYHKTPFNLFDQQWINSINQRFMLNKLSKSMRYLNFKNPHLICYYPNLLPILEQLNLGKKIFHIVDEWSALPGIPNSLEELVKKMLHAADLTVVSGSRLYQKYQNQTKNIALLRHGADLALFQQTLNNKITSLEALQTVTGPKVGYYGALHKLDYELIVNIAHSLPDITFFFLGPTVGRQGYALPETLPNNIRFLPPLSYQQLPRFLVGLDAFWMPYQNNELTQAMCSIKMYEVMSAGLPIVITELEECKAVLADKAFHCNTTQEHITALKEAIKPAQAQQSQRLLRSQHVAQYDWDNQLKQLLSLIEQA